MRPGTTICVPTWGGAALIGETLHALQRQEGPAFEIHISVDGNDQETAAACAPFLADPRIRLTLQPRRLGWVGNTNALLAAAETEFVAIMPHDDLPAPGWLAALHQALRAHPQAICAFSDVEAFGTSTARHIQPDLAGPRLRRMLDTLLHHNLGIHYRSLIRRPAGAAPPPLPTSLPGDVAADLAWLMDLALRGEVRRVPRALVRKRFHPRNTHGPWSSRPASAQRATATSVLAHMRAAALAAEPAAPASTAVNLAALLRLAGCGEPLLPAEHAALPELFAAYDEATGGAGAAPLPSWQEVARRPELELLAARLGAPSFRRALTAAETALVGTPHAALAATLRTLARDVTRDRLHWRRRWSRAARNVAEALRRRSAGP